MHFEIHNTHTHTAHTRVIIYGHMSYGTYINMENVVNIFMFRFLLNKIQSNKRIYIHYLF